MSATIDLPYLPPHMMNSGFISAEERDAVEAEQIKAFFRETNDQNLAGALVLSLLVYVVHEGIPAWTWQPALFALYAVTLVRAWQVKRYRSAPYSRSTAQWGRSQAVTGALAGVCWGFANTAMLTHLPTESQLLILTVITVSASVNAAEGFAYVPPSRAYILASLVPPTAWLLTVGDRLHTILGAMLLIFLPITLWQAVKRNRIFIEAQQLRFRNEALAGELTVQRDVAEQAYRSKARFLAAASHDLRQPMQALAIFHELLARETQTARGAELLTSARQSAEAMATLLGALLDVSKLDANVVSVDCRAFPLQTLLDEMAREFTPIAAQKGIALRVRPCTAVVRSDPALLGQVLRNLLSNAIRYTPEGRVLLACRRRGGMLRIGVFDTGIGIAVDQHTAIFGEFYQIGNEARDRRQGIGLGLAIVERVTRLLGHALNLRSVPGRGSCFSVTVPVAQMALPLEPGTMDMESVLATAGLDGRRVLVVEDEAAIRAGLQTLLQDWGCEVSTAGSMAEAMAVDAALHDTLDAVVCDVGLPGPGNGIDTIAALRTRHDADLPALLVTGDTSQAALRAAHEAGLVVLHKPIKPARLRAALSNAIAARPRWDERGGEARACSQSCDGGAGIKSGCDARRGDAARFISR
ncbi:MAG: hybrid sensor histidine kinase/response regulator [Rhodocyclales bacterium]|nr:hybrid sensor histidine kinase/response regulator [Rhodocyclales bacterium]